MTHQREGSQVAPQVECGEDVFDFESSCASSPGLLSPSPALSPTPGPSVHASTPSPSMPFSGPPPSKKRKQSEQVDSMMSLAYDRLSTLPSVKREEADPCKDFARVVSNELKTMNELQRKLAKKLIYDVLHMGDMDSLTVEHKIVKVVCAAGQFMS